MTVYRCTNCGHVLAPRESPCPKCGDTRRTADQPIGTTTSSTLSLNMTIKTIREEVQKNWLLIIILVLGDVFSTIPAYIFNGWASVVITLLFIIFSTVVGYYAITRVVNTTIEHR